MLPGALAHPAPRPTPAEGASSHRPPAHPPAASLLLRQVFGKGLYTYMMWQRMMRDALFISLLFSASNMIYNLTGDGLDGACTFYSCPTLGNVDDVNTSYAAVEVIVAITFIYW